MWLSILECLKKRLWGYMASVDNEDFTSFVSAGAGSVWNNPGNAASSDNSYATCVDLVGVGQRLECTGADLSAIPSGATITNIQIDVERSADFNDGGHSGRRVEDVDVYLIVSSVAVGTNKAQGLAWPLTDTYASYVWDSADIAALGGLTGADIQSNFGFYLKIFENRGDGDNPAKVDHCRISVDYTVGGITKRIIRIVG